jgi:MOSC domain-containing protein YiiM|tara:strand:+ start:707 stop:1144 length:438 start_codon:yes stop_codon:yes gene_type:complete
MGKVLEIGISIAKGSKIQNLNSVEAYKGKGILNDRKFKEDNKKENQLTLIEIENIIYFNKISQSKILPVDFRRNIITKGVNLNNLLNKEFFVGKVKLKAHELCRPCKYLQEKLKQNNFIKELLYKGGLRCEILSSGKINVGDIIK